MKTMILRIFLIFISNLAISSLSQADEIIRLDPKEINIETDKVNGSYEINVLYKNSLILKVTRFVSQYSANEGVIILAMEKKPIEGIQYLNFVEEEADKIARTWNQNLVDKIINHETVELNLGQWDKYSPERLFGQNRTYLKNVPKQQISFESILTGTTFGKKYNVIVKVANKPVAFLIPSRDFLSKADSLYNWGVRRFYFKEDEARSVIKKLISQLDLSEDYIDLNLENESEKIVEKTTANNLCGKIF